MSPNTQLQQKNEGEHTNFAQRLAKSMEARRFSKLSLAKKIGVAHTTVAAWLKGAEPSSEKIAPLASALSVDAHWLLFGERADVRGISIDASFEDITRLLEEPPAVTVSKMSDERLEEELIDYANFFKVRPKGMRAPVLKHLAIVVNELAKRLASQKPRSYDPSEPPKTTDAP